LDPIYLSFQEVARLLEEGIRNGVVQPLKYTLFSSEKAEEAFRYTLTNFETI
jgi:hypothetical protein